MCWVAVDRGVRLAEDRGDDERAARWRAVADEIKAEILENGVSERKVFRQHYETEDLDAALLLIPIMGFLPPTTTSVRNTVLAIADELTEDGSGDSLPDRVHRHRVHGQRGHPPSAPSGWSAPWPWWVRPPGRGSSARSCFRWPARLLLYAEEIDTSTGQHLGNFPQAFTHLALIEAVWQLIEAEQGTATRPV